MTSLTPHARITFTPLLPSQHDHPSPTLDQTGAFGLSPSGGVLVGPELVVSVPRGTVVERSGSMEAAGGGGEDEHGPSLFWKGTCEGKEGVWRLFLLGATEADFTSIHRILLFLPPTPRLASKIQQQQQPHHHTHIHRTAPFAGGSMKPTLRTLGAGAGGATGGTRGTLSAKDIAELQSSLAGMSVREGGGAGTTKNAQYRNSLLLLDEETNTLIGIIPLSSALTPPTRPDLAPSPTRARALATRIDELAYNISPGNVRAYPREAMLDPAKVRERERDGSDSGRSVRSETKREERQKGEEDWAWETGLFGVVGGVGGSPGERRGREESEESEKLDKEGEKRLDDVLGGFVVPRRTDMRREVEVVEQQEVPPTTTTTTTPAEDEFRTPTSSTFLPPSSSSNSSSTTTSTKFLPSPFSVPPTPSTPGRTIPLGIAVHPSFSSSSDDDNDTQSEVGTLATISPSELLFSSSRHPSTSESKSTHSSSREPTYITAPSFTHSVSSSISTISPHLSPKQRTHTPHEASILSTGTTTAFAQLGPNAVLLNFLGSDEVETREVGEEEILRRGLVEASEESFLQVGVGVGAEEGGVKSEGGKWWRLFEKWGVVVKSLEEDDVEGGKKEKTGWREWIWSWWTSCSPSSTTLSPETSLLPPSPPRIESPSKYPLASYLSSPHRRKGKSRANGETTSRLSVLYFDEEGVGRRTFVEGSGMSGMGGGFALREGGGGVEVY